MKKTTIFLAGDSTVQSYKTKDFPQCGWGAMLWKYFSDKDVVVTHPGTRNLIMSQGMKWMIW